MLQRTVKLSALAATLLAAVALAPAAFGGGTAWNVSIGGPGFAISAGQPGYGGSGYVGVGVRYGGVGVGYGGYGGQGYGHRPYHRPYYPAPAARVVVPAPVVYSAPYPYVAPVPYVVPVAPRPYRIVAPIPRRAYAPALPPVVVPYRGW